MAARENQSLQIALIVFVSITVILAVTTYIYWRQVSELALEKRAEQTAKEKSDDELRRLAAELQEVKQVLGHLPTATLAEVKSQGETDMSLFAENYQGPRSYVALPSFLLDEIAKRNRLIADLESLNLKLVDQIRETGHQGDVRLAASHADREKLKNELVTEQTTFASHRERMQRDGNKIAGQLEVKGREAAATAEKHQQEVDLLNKTIAQLRRMVDGLREALQQTRPKGEAETADGKITYVDQRSRTVGINLGSADGLRRGLTFSVVDRDAAKVGSARQKGSIEVVNIPEPHFAIARIQSDDLRDPMLSNDQIFSPLWQPGQKIRFALAGLLDLNGDGHSDRGLIRSLIEQHGGVIDGETDDQGLTTGSMRFETRYLVVGARPNERTHEAALRGYSAMVTEADRLGVEKLPLDKFLQMVGYRPNDRLVPLNQGVAPPEREAPRRPGIR